MLQSYLKKITKNGKKPAYYLKIDIRNFFMWINKHILFQLLSKRCRDSDLKWLLKVIVFLDSTMERVPKVRVECKSTDIMSKNIPSS